MRNPIRSEPLRAHPSRLSFTAFRSLALEMEKTVAGLAPAQGYPAATQLFSQGAPAQDVYVLAGGLVKLTGLEANGQETIVDLRSPGWLLGSAAILLQTPYPVTATTLVASQLHRLRAEPFLQLIQTNPVFSWQLHQLHSREMYEYLQWAQLLCLSARQRLEHTLWTLWAALAVNTSQKEIRLPLPLRHWELARLLAITPTYLSRLYQQMERDGLLRRAQGRLILCDPEALWHGDPF